MVPSLSNIIWVRSPQNFTEAKGTCRRCPSLCITAEDMRLDEPFFRIAGAMRPSDTLDTPRGHIDQRKHQATSRVGRLILNTSLSDHMADGHRLTRDSNRHHPRLQWQGRGGSRQKATPPHGSGGLLSHSYCCKRVTKPEGERAAPQTN